jgi:hypothetical protein
MQADSVRATVQALKLDGEPFARIFRLREESETGLSEMEMNDLFAAYLEQIERVIEAVDRMPSEAQGMIA